MTKKLVPTVIKDKQGNIVDTFFDIVLVIDKDNNLQIFNSKEYGDWREEVDWNTLIVKEIKLRP